MVAILNINDYRNDKAIVLSQNVIQTDGTGTYVYVAKEEANQMVASKQKITLGLSNNGLAEVTGGLKPGDKVITVGYQELVEGTKIKL